MTFDECVNGWIEQYDEFAECLNKILLTNIGFQETINKLSEKYEKLFYTKNCEGNHALVFLLIKYGHEMHLHVYKDKHERAVLSDTVCFFLFDNVYECTINELHNSSYREMLNEKHGQCFNECVYFVNVYKSDCSYLETTSGMYNTPREALDFAIGRQKYLSANELDCCFIVISCGRKKKRNVKFIEPPYEYYRISTKTKGETMRLMRIKGLRFYVNEFIETIPNPENMQNNINESAKGSFFMMTIVSVDDNGNMKCNLERYPSKERARQVAEFSIDKWMSENNFTLDEKACSFCSLCEKEDYDNFIEVRHIKGIAEINVLIKEYEFNSIQNEL